MFTLNEKYENDGKVLKSDYITYSPSKLSTINTVISQKFINMPREDSLVSFLPCYADLKFDLVHAATNNNYADVNDMRLVNLAPITYFSSYKLTRNSGKHNKDINHAHIVSLRHKLKTNSKESDDLSIGFDRDR